jgi:hypothetical protein
MLVAEFSSPELAGRALSDVISLEGCVISVAVVSLELDNVVILGLGLLVVGVIVSEVAERVVFPGPRLLGLVVI